MVEKEIGQFSAKQVNASFVTHLPVSGVSSPCFHLHILAQAEPKVL